MSKRVFITGSAGFIGFHTVKRFLEAGYRVVGIDNLNAYYDPQLKKDRLAQLDIEVTEDEARYQSGEFVFYRGDLQDSALLERIFQNDPFDGIVNLAAQAGVRYSIENPQTYIDSNITGFLNILELARRHRIGHVVYASSSSVYGLDAAQPFSEKEASNKQISMYAASKKANESMAEVYAHLFGIRLSGLRFFTVYGPWGRPDMAPMLFAKAAFAGEPIKVFNYGNQSRDFTFVDDIVEGVFRVYETERDTRHEIYNIGNGSPVNLLRFIETIEKASGRAIEKHMTEAQPGDVTVTYADISKLAKHIDFRPQTDIEAGIGQFIEWYVSYFKP